MAGFVRLRYSAMTTVFLVVASNASTEFDVVIYERGPVYIIQHARMLNKVYTHPVLGYNT
jgi:hypothetical protein